MSLCADCHDDTPSKATFTEFAETLQALGVEWWPGIREFYSDYRTSSFGDVSAYWEACSA